MLNFSGEYDCKVDAKGRLLLPAKLVRQLPNGGDSKLMINRGIENHLTLFTEDSWKEVMERVATLNDYDPKHRKLRRLLLRGASEASIDSSNRMALPKRIAAQVGIERDVVVLGIEDKIEIWDAETYDGVMDVDADDFNDLASQILGQPSQTTPPNEPA